MKASLLLLPVFLVITGCGLQAGETPAATVNGQTISRSELKRYMNYSLAFYAWSNSRPDRKVCDSKMAHTDCRRLGRQVLGRLVQERVVTNYATTHRISLGGKDKARLNAETAHLVSARDARGRRLADVGIKPALLRTILERELIVRRVEDRVTSPNGSAKGGALVREFDIPRPAKGSVTAWHRMALDLAVVGSPVPPGTSVRKTRTNPSTLPADVREALSGATAGEYIGPFFIKNRYVVMQVVAPSDVLSQPRKVAAFTSWLRQQTEAAHLQCYDPEGRAVKCAAPR